MYIWLVVVVDRQFYLLLGEVYKEAGFISQSKVCYLQHGGVEVSQQRGGGLLRRATSPRQPRAPIWNKHITISDQIRRRQLPRNKIKKMLKIC